MTISVIIPILNEAAILEKTLQHVASLDGDYEVIVVDGGSTDGSTAIAGRYARVIGSSRGRSIQMNLGANEARGEVLLFLHADTILPDGAFGAIEKSLANPAVVGGRFKVRLDEAGWQYRMVGSSINLRDRLLKGFTGDQAIFIRTATFKTLGGYRDIPLMEDIDLGRRMGRLGRVVQLPLAVVTSARRWKKNGVFRTILLMWALRLTYLVGYSSQRLRRFYGDTR